MAFDYGSGVSDELLSTTLAAYSKKLEDNVFKSNPTAWWLVGQYPDTPNTSTQSKGKKETQNGGITIVRPLMYGKNTSAKSYAGYELLDTTPQEGITAAQYNWKQMSVSITISGKEERINSGEAAMINLLKAKTMQAEMSLKDLLAEQIVGTGTDTTKELLGLQTGVATTGTVGGINRATTGNEHPDFGVTDQATYQYYEKVLQPQERFHDTKTADGGFENLKFKGMVLCFDNNTYFPSGYMYMLNSEYLYWTVHPDADFSTTPFQRPVNQDARTAQILVQGEFNASNWQRQGVMTGITA